MSKTFYSEYLYHMMYFYASGEKTVFGSDVDAENYRAVDAVMRGLPFWDRCVIMEVYKEKGRMKERVRLTAEKFNVSENVVWTILSKTLKKIAKERGLI